ncbi:MAG: DUF2817 domain-containing protein [Bdellovibrionales bacterium]|nr:DUF2817 domain-containing protein [Bdellovibrionales bacterium]
MADFFELHYLEEILHRNDSLLDYEMLTEVSSGRLKFPVYGFSLGSNDPGAPVFGLFAGVHGIERVGSHVALKFLDSFFYQLSWDEQLADLLNHVKIIGIPIINPGGMYHNSRSNPNGVDLMRNAPVDTESPHFLVSGHRLGTFLPWYRGKNNLELENEALINFVKSRASKSPFCMTLDIHSGFGSVDRLWFPFAKTRDPFPHYTLAQRFRQLLDRTHPGHVYKVEPQSHSYLTHGDSWDYLFELISRENSETVYIPWTLEMGSWIWLKKNPRQLFSSGGIFNPILPHRYNRTIRRHRTLIDIMVRSVANYKKWSLISA